MPGAGGRRSLGGVGEDGPLALARKAYQRRPIQTRSPAARREMEQMPKRERDVRGMMAGGREVMGAPRREGGAVAKLGTSFGTGFHGTPRKPLGLYWTQTAA